MPRLIDADRFCEYCVDYDICKDEHIDYCFERDLVAKQPTIAPSTLRPKGEWIGTHDGWYYSYSCSECGAEALTKEGTMHDQLCSNFCPNCGADMRGEDDG